jgi:hypothetical protein
MSLLHAIGSPHRPPAVLAIRDLLRVDMAQAAKVAATIRLLSADMNKALNLFIAKRDRPAIIALPANPTDEDVQKACDELFDRYRDKWWVAP